MVRWELLEPKTHFSFSENWSQYAEKIDEARIEEADGLLDIGCGSGLDPKSVETTRRTRQFTRLIQIGNVET
jgi:predicted TPR repeat methyltransferase